MNLDLKTLTKVLFYASPLIFCFIWHMILGKDMNWDARNYHFYAGFSFLNDRLAQDFLPAGPQSYLNPITYIPFYLLVSNFENGLYAGLMLASIHSLVIYFTYFIAKALLENQSSTVLVFIATTLSSCTTVFLHQIGSSFIDIYVCILVLGGVFYLLKYQQRPSVYACLTSAFLLGFAVGIKLTSGIYALSAAICAFYVMCISDKKLTHFLYFSLAGLIGTLSVQGWWAYQVYLEFGNPLFPYFNSLFCSQYVSCESIVNYRFIPVSFKEAFALPFRMILPSRWLYTEILAPDLRLAAAMILLPTLMIFWFKKRFVFSQQFQVVLMFWAGSYILWLLTSGNGRYGMPIFILVGILLVYALIKLFDTKRAMSYSLVLLILQLSIVSIGSEFRWHSAPSSKQYFEYILPEEITRTPALYVTTEAQSDSYLIPQFHPDSSFVSVSGQLPLHKDKALQKLNSFRILHQEKVRFVTEIDLQQDELVTSVPWHVLFNTKLARFGWVIEPEECQYVENQAAKLMLNQKYMAVCELRYSEEVLASFKKSAMSVDKVFDTIERFCPHLFSPSTMVSEKIGKAWIRWYVGTETRLWIKGHQVQKQNSSETDFVNMGTIEDWLYKPVEAASHCYKTGVKRSRLLL